MNKKRNTVYLPEDLVVEILSRVPDASLARFRSISKGWNALIKKEERLAKKSQILMLIDFRVYSASVGLNGSQENVVKATTSQFSLKDTLSNPSKEVAIRNVFHCDGLLLCTTKNKRLVVWNPRSGETRWIKPRNSYKEHATYALGKSSCNKYTILRMYGRSNVGPVKFETYDFTSNSWRSIVKKYIKWCIPQMCSSGTSVSGNTYWLAHSQIGNGEKVLLSFDFSIERFGLVNLPGNDLSSRVDGLSVTREDHQLCLLITQSGEVFDTIDLWRATKIETNFNFCKTKTETSWSKFLSVKTAHVYHWVHQRRWWSANFLADRETNVLLYRGMYLSAKNSIHIVGEDKNIQVGYDDAGSDCSLLFSYVPTLVQIK
ncbi:unnamed protein product [Microthlaspi erraticum]|uniref:F-box domain-containing protein n=1 Tax=Microthlaspi erraticum TaxID=1685480 RepID=A0A6D2IQ63_9BRAS|nr:unnamed protein product [Microthlaspi erraticum]